MSHYAVAVFSDPVGQSVEELLAPFSEQLEVPHYISKEEIIKSVRNKIENFRKSSYEKYLENKEAYLAKCTNKAHIEYITKVFPKELLWTDEQCYEDGVKYYNKENIQPDGSVYSTYNPKSKWEWDWYSIGGRFSDRIPLKNGEYTDEANACDVDINHIDKERYDGALMFWELCIDGRTPKNNEEKRIAKEGMFFNKEYYTERFSTAEEYAEYCARFTFFSALLPTGEWLEAGKMGWFGISSSTVESEKEWREKQKEILEKAVENGWNITIVDCHI